MKVLVKKPGEITKKLDIEGELEELQTLVHGYVQMLYPYKEDKSIVCLVDEEGKLKGKHINIYVKSIGYLVGTIVFLALKDNKFVGLSQKQINFIKREVDDNE